MLLQVHALPTAPRPVIVGVSLVYFAVCGTIAAWAARRTRTADDFFVAGTGIGLWTMTLAAMAATLSGFIFVGGPGLLLGGGIGYLFISLSASITTPLSAWALARPMRLLREIRGVVTVPDAVGARYRSPGAQGICAIAILIASAGYIATNLLALGLVMDAIFHIGMVLSILAGSTVVLAYSATGGILAGVYTDVFQGTIKAGASVLVFLTVLRGGGGLAGISRTILMHDAAFLGPWGHLTPLAALSLFFLFGMGTLGQPQVLSKYYMLRDPRQLRWYPLLMTLVLLVTLLLFFAIGLGVKAAVVSGAMPPLAHNDDATPAFLLQRASPWLAAVVFSGITAAIMGTVNAFLNIAAAAITHDLPVALGRPVRNELRGGRIATVGVAIAATAVALQPGAVVGFLGIFSWGLFASTLVPSLAIGMNWTGATRAGAIASILVGLVATIGFESLAHFNVFAAPAGVSGSALALVASLLTFLAVSWWSRCDAVGELDADVGLVVGVSQ
jgi:Na+/proline symporter